MKPWLTACVLALLAVAGCAPVCGALPEVFVLGLSGLIEPRLIQKPAPAYSDKLNTELREIGDTGWVDLEIVVKENGSVEHAKVLNIEPPLNRTVILFSELSLSNVKLWRFEPAVIQGTDEAVKVKFSARLWCNGEWGIQRQGSPLLPCSKSTARICGVDGMQSVKDPSAK